MNASNGDDGNGGGAEVGCLVPIAGCSCITSAGEGVVSADGGKYALTTSMMMAYTALRGGPNGIPIGRETEDFAPLIRDLASQEVASEVTGLGYVCVFSRFTNALFSACLRWNRRKRRAIIEQDMLIKSVGGIRMLHDIVKELAADEQGRAGPSRQSVFYIDRPADLEHLLVPTDNKRVAESDSLVVDDQTAANFVESTSHPPTAGSNSNNDEYPAISKLSLEEFGGTVAFLGEEGKQPEASTTTESKGKGKEVITGANNTDDTSSVAAKQSDDESGKKHVIAMSNEPNLDDSTHVTETRPPAAPSHSTAETGPHKPAERITTPDTVAHSMASNLEIMLFDDGYVSDDEGPRDTGRISPCTFAYWAQGCQSYKDLAENKPLIAEVRLFVFPQ